MRTVGPTAVVELTSAQVRDFSLFKGDYASEAYL